MLDGNVFAKDVVPSAAEWAAQIGAESAIVEVSLDNGETFAVWATQVSPESPGWVGFLTEDDEFRAVAAERIVSVRVKERPTPSPERPKPPVGFTAIGR